MNSIHFKILHYLQAAKYKEHQQQSNTHRRVDMCTGRHAMGNTATIRLVVLFTGGRAHFMQRRMV